MKINTYKHKIIFVTSVTIVAFFYVLSNSIYYAKTDEIKLPSYIENDLTEKHSFASKDENIKISGFTSRLSIPSLKIKTKIQSVGITKNGNMSTPNNYVDVGLYKYGTMPGEKGSAVIAGHVDNGLGLKAVFGNLKNIKMGDDIYVEMEENVKIHFIVKSISIYDFNARVDEVFNQNDDSYLKLITCGGTWIPSLRTHDKRIVVTAIKVNY